MTLKATIDIRASATNTLKVLQYLFDNSVIVNIEWHVFLKHADIAAPHPEELSQIVRVEFSTDINTIKTKLKEALNSANLAENIGSIYLPRV